MKKTLYWIAAFLLIFATNAMVAQNSRDNGRAKTIKLDKRSFLKRVANYEDSPTVWKYLGDKPAVIDFYADWCGPCRRLAPLLDELAAEYEGRVYIYKVNVDDQKEIAQAFGITSLPTIVFIPMQGNPSAGTGFLPKEILRNAINELLPSKAETNGQTSTK